jgi:hypothetical protein
MTLPSACVRITEKGSYPDMALGSSGTLSIR